MCRTHTQNTPLNMAADCTMYYVCIVHTMHNYKALSYYHHNSLIIMARHALSIRGRWQPNNLLRHLLLDKGPLTWRVGRHVKIAQYFSAEMSQREHFISGTVAATSLIKYRNDILSISRGNFSGATT